LRLANGRQDVGRRLRRLRSVSCEQTSDLPLRPRRDHDRTRLGQGLCPRRDIWHVAEDFARRIDRCENGNR
jgi:hypothetical protein